MILYDCSYNFSILLTSRVRNHIEIAPFVYYGHMVVAIHYYLNVNAERHILVDSVNGRRNPLMVDVTTKI